LKINKNRDNGPGELRKKSILDIFIEADNKRRLKRFYGRCVVCGGVFKENECIECGHMVIK